MEARLTFNSAWRWYFLNRPLHDALIEDLFDKVESQVVRFEHPRVWSSRVRKLRQKRRMSPVKNQMPRWTAPDGSEMMEVCVVNLTLPQLPP